MEHGHELEKRMYNEFWETQHTMMLIVFGCVAKEVKADQSVVGYYFSDPVAVARGIRKHRKNVR